MTQRFKVYDGTYAHFITSSVTYWLPIFTRDDYFRLLADSLNFCSTNKGLQLHGYVIMPNHFHAICSQSDGKLSEVIRDLKGYTSRQLSAKLIKDGRELWVNAMRRASADNPSIKFWQDEFHPEQIYSKPFFDQKLRYMHENPMRAGFVSDPCEWKYSSAGLYYRDEISAVNITPIEW